MSSTIRIVVGRTVSESPDPAEQSSISNYLHHGSYRASPRIVPPTRSHYAAIVSGTERMPPRRAPAGSRHSSLPFKATVCTHLSAHDAERLPRRMKRGTDACARQGRRVSDSLHVPRAENAPALLLYFRESDTRHPWPGTPAALNRQNRTAPPDRAGGVLCGAEVKEEAATAGRRRGTWSAAEHPGGPIATALLGFPVPSLTPPKFTPGMEEYGSCQRCVHTVALKGREYQCY